jgi:CheY-like chemotaxis protein
MLRNLVSNALRFTEEGGVVVTARPIAGQAAVEVWDTGCGIEPAEQRRIFSEFYQVPGQSLARGPGLGLGLTIVDGLARAMGQTVELVSRPGRGSRFRILMPLDHGSDAPAAAALPEAAVEILRDRLVLVVENDEQVRRGLAAVLGRWGARVIAAETGEHALGVTTAVCPHAIVADWHLSGAVDGFAVIERIRQRHSGHPVAAVILTADTNLKNLSTANPGGIAVLFKPVPPDILRAVLAAELASRLRSPAPAA